MRNEYLDSFELLSIRIDQLLNILNQVNLLYSYKTFH